MGAGISHGTGFRIPSPSKQRHNSPRPLVELDDTRAVSALAEESDRILARASGNVIATQWLAHHDTYHGWQAELQADFEESSAPRASMFFADFVRFQAKHVRRWIAQRTPDSGRLRLPRMEEENGFRDCLDYVCQQSLDCETESSPHDHQWLRR